MTQPVLDLAEVDPVDLQALRLGAQVMRHKAVLAARPRVEAFFVAVQRVVEDELARRRGGEAGEAHEPLLAPSLLPLLDEPGVGARPGARSDAATGEDRLLAADYLELLASNDRLGEPVRHAVGRLRERLLAPG